MRCMFTLQMNFDYFRINLFSSKKKTISSAISFLKSKITATKITNIIAIVFLGSLIKKQIAVVATCMGWIQDSLVSFVNCNLRTRLVYWL